MVFIFFEIENLEMPQLKNNYTLELNIQPIKEIRTYLRSNQVIVETDHSSHIYTTVSLYHSIERMNC